MAADIVPELYGRIMRDFEGMMDTNGSVAGIKKRIAEGTAQLADVHAYAENVGHSLSAALQKNLTAETLPDGKLYYNIAQRTIVPAARTGYDVTNEAAVEILGIRDRAEGLGINAVTADFQTSRAEALATKAVDAADDFARYLGEPIVTLAESFADNFMRANVDFRRKLGMEPKIRRDVQSKCCEWCGDMAGTYPAGDAPETIYQRHEYCRCVVTFENGSMRKDVWSKSSWEAPPEELKARESYGTEVTKLTAQQVEDRIARIERDREIARVEARGVSRSKARRIVNAGG